VPSISFRQGHSSHCRCGRRFEDTVVGESFSKAHRLLSLRKAYRDVVMLLKLVSLNSVVEIFGLIYQRLQGLGQRCRFEVKSRKVALLDWQH
jgi:hypothetical protein